MAVLIGHASLDERRRIKGGQAGDQTGGEVTTRSWYSKPWSLVLRAKNAKVAEAMAVACEKGCANPKIGYDQNQRNSLNTQAKKVGYDLGKITVGCETDCSAFMTVCAWAAGVKVPYNGTNAPTTSTMKTAFTSTGAFEVLTDNKYLSSDKYLKRGDILVKPGSHTVMVLGNGSNTTTEERCDMTLNVLKKGATGKQVKALQLLLKGYGYSLGNAGVDGSFGPATRAAVIQYQKCLGLTADGIVGEITWAHLLGV